MAMKITLEEFLGVDEVPAPSAAVMAEKMTIETLTDVFLRMKQLDMNQKQLAEMLDVTPSALSKLLSNGTNLRYSTVCKLAEALDCDIVAPKLVPLETGSVSRKVGTTSSQMTFSTEVYARLNDKKAGEEYEKLCSNESDAVEEETFDWNFIRSQVMSKWATGVK